MPSYGASFRLARAPSQAAKFAALAPPRPPGPNSRRRLALWKFLTLVLEPNSPGLAPKKNLTFSLRIKKRNGLLTRLGLRNMCMTGPQGQNPN